MSDGSIDFVLGILAGLVTALGVVAIVALFVVNEAKQL